MHRRDRHGESGVVLIEALVAILLFLMGVLGLVAAVGQTVSNEADSEYRTVAAKAAAEMMNTIWVNVSRSTPQATVNSLQAFQYQSGGNACSFNGVSPNNPLVAAWVSALQNGVVNQSTGVADPTTALPGTGNMQQILVNTAAGSFNNVQITVCWQGPHDNFPHRYVLSSYIN